MEEHRNSKEVKPHCHRVDKDDVRPIDTDMSRIKSSSATNVDLEWITEAREVRFFAQLWDCDGLFKPYATAAFTVGSVSTLSSAERVAFYREVATKSRVKVLTDLSGIEVRPGTLRLLS